MTFQKRMVTRAAVFPVGLEDVTSLRIARPEAPTFPAEADGARFRVEADTRCEVLHFAD